MNIKKRIVSIATSLVAFVSAGSFALGAHAYVDVTQNVFSAYADVYTYDVRYTGTYANICARPTYTSVTAVNSSYSGSYKECLYSQQGESYGSYYYITSRYKDGTTNSVYTGPVSVTSEVAKREQNGKIYNTSNPNSSLKEYFYATIIKN